MDRREFRDLAAPEEASAAIDALEITGGVTEVPLTAARDRTLADRVDAGIDVPGFDRAAMDGYAVRARDTFGAFEGSPVVLPVVGTVQAGDESDVSVADGEAVGIATGAVLPPGADAVVPVERTVERESTVDVESPVAPGDCVMPRGADVAAGDRALGPGVDLGPRHIGLLAALGRERVPVRKRPRVGVVATGAELVQPGESLRPTAGQIYDVNSHSISAAVEAAGGEPVRYVADSDDEATLRDTLVDASADCDLLLTSGSTSAGTADVLHRLIERDGEVLVHGVAIKPGRPLLVGRLFETPYVGLPGYPVSALSVFRTFVAPRLRAASGRPVPESATVLATLATRVRYDGGRLRLLPVGLVEDGDGSLLAYASRKGSGATTTLVEADGVVRMPAETSLLTAGDAVTVDRFADASVPSLLGVGDTDPAFLALLDRLDSTRFLALAPDDARRWLADGIPDVLVTDPTVLADAVETDPIGDWTREWGLVARRDDADGIATLSDLVDRDLRFANLAESLSIRRAFDARLADAGIDDPGARIDGYSRELPGIESAARSVAAGRADAGLGLRATAVDLDLAFVPAGRQRIAVLPNPDRRDETAVTSLRETVTTDLTAVLSEMPGYGSSER